MSNKKQDIEVEIKFEKGTSTKSEKLLALAELLRALVDGEIEYLNSNNSNCEKIKEYEETLQILDCYIEHNKQNF